MESKQQLPPQDEILAVILDEYGEDDLAPVERAEAIKDTIDQVDKLAVPDDEAFDVLAGVGELVEHEDGLFYGRLLKRAVVIARTRRQFAQHRARHQAVVKVSGVHYKRAQFDDPKDC